MAVNKCVTRNFSRIAIFAQLFSFATASSVVNFANPLTDPCFGHKDGRARSIDIDSSFAECRTYFECINGMKTTEEPFMCPYDLPFFDAQIEDCVKDSGACFSCSSNSEYELFPVPHAPNQLVQCFRHKPLLMACADNLEFDARIRECNVKQLCRTKNFTGKRCLSGGPYYEIDNDDPTVYYICWDEWNSLCAQCPYGLQFNTFKETCEFA
ncbi:uncharacterized protein LOC129566325 [Sitodiplosis mosellana]|uniref:uncharacterized protein LOC129566325 n=1 Tax=Sitodiplosis mosellana TaxID=263140 RepID=UPI002444FD79|nr:uncharacterized protein LOC129566325 [Sitodiplosis mosellana]